MRATLEGDDGFPVLFTMSFPSGEGGEPVDTVCTAPVRLGRRDGRRVVRAALR